MSLAVLVFAAVALRVAGEMPHHAQRFAYAWRFTGCALLLVGCNSLFHDAFATVAFLSGPESGAWAAVLRWHPVLNHSRTFLLSTYCLVLAVALYRIGHQKEPLPVARGMAIVVAGMLVGGLVGRNEVEFTILTHFSAVAVFDIMELLAVMVLLSVGLVSGVMDRSLWVAMGLNGFIVALSVLLFAAISRVEFAGQWAPKPLHMQWTKATLHVLMVAIAVRHLHRIRQGHPIRGLLDPPVQGVGLPSLHP